MNYKGFDVVEIDDGIIIDGVEDFNPVHIFDCGQCFRWLRQPDGSYTGVVGKKAVNVSYFYNRLTILNASLKDFQAIWYDYFDLGRDYKAVKALLKKDEIMEKAIEFGYGIRLLKQDIREMVISFIISANNMIPRIMKTVRIISEMYGDRIALGDKVYFTFPDIEKLANSSLEQLEVCKGGFRCRYIIGASRMIAENKVNLEALNAMDTETARKELMKLPGVGPKVADCILLYSGTKYDVFPTDVWVKRVMEVLYFKKETSFKEIQAFAREYFGDLAGFAQQYLFYYARENKIGAGQI